VTLSQQALISKAGYGKQGYCKLCSFAEVDAVNDRLKRGFNARQVNDFLRQYGMQVNRQTIYAHKDHITHPADKVVAAAEKARMNPVIKNATTDQFLEAIKDIGFRRAQQNPDEVTVDHALKAASILSQKKENGTNVFLLMAKVITGNAPAVVVEGQSEEVS
jgi:hypothetical protein